jgi:hypothetical protein
MLNVEPLRSRLVASWYRAHDQSAPPSAAELIARTETGPKPAGMRVWRLDADRWIAIVDDEARALGMRVVEIGTQQRAWCLADAPVPSESAEHIQLDILRRQPIVVVDLVALTAKLKAEREAIGREAESLFGRKLAASESVQRRRAADRARSRQRANIKAAS